MSQYQTKEAYYSDLRSRDFLPDGFKTAVASLEFYPKEKPSQKPYKMNLNAIVLDQATSLFAGMFTRNRFPGAPVIIGKNRVKGKSLRAVLINNKISNVCAPKGVEASERLCAEFARAIGCRAEEVIPCSTGIIGWSLPVEEMSAKLPTLVSELKGDSYFKIAQGIMTTDSFPKMRSYRFSNGATIAITGKGAGMIEPNLATMLVYIATDVRLPRSFFNQALREAVEGSFNTISIDSDQSTSDTVLLLSSGLKTGVTKNEFKTVLKKLCRELAEDIVRNGEGTSHVIEVSVSGAKNKAEAKAIGKAVVNSPLVKSAIYGNDPNVGRILSSVGDFLGNCGLSADAVDFSIRIGGEPVFENGVFHLDTDKEERLYQYFKKTSLPEQSPGFPVHSERTCIEVALKRGNGTAVVLGSDLSFQYVRENAEYRS